MNYEYVRQTEELEEITVSNFGEEERNVQKFGLGLK